MAGYKETPRQKMIAMMYLVLTALLALNVSKAMLDAFIVVNESTEATNVTFSNKIRNTYARFDQQMAINPNKVKPFHDKAMKAKKLSDDMTNYIDSIKYAVIVATDARIETMEQARTTPLKEIKSVDRYTEPTRFFFGHSDDGSAGEGRILKNKINVFRTMMLEIASRPKDSHRLGMITDGDYSDADGAPQNWEEHNFYYTVLAADVAILNKLITDVKNAEFDVVSYLYSSVTAEDFKFNKIEAKVIPRSHYVFVGEEYEAEIIVAAVDTIQDPDIYYLEGVDALTETNIGNARQVEGRGAFAKIVIPATSTGIKKYAGRVTVKSPTGEEITYSFKDEYLVAMPSLTVSATKMNVFYTGVDNPVSIAVSGIGKERIHPSISVGTLTPDPDGVDYIVKIPGGSTGKAVISVDAEYEGGTKSMGLAEFRIKRVPDPSAYIANVNQGNIDKNKLIAAGAIIPQMPEDFEFDLNFVIVSYTFTSVRSGDIFERQARGNALTEEMKNFIRASRRGTKIWFENIIAKGPDGNTPLGTISLVVN